jgi:hypothetical protein
VQIFFKNTFFKRKKINISIKMSTGFSSLEKTNKLFNSLICYDEALSLKYISKLVNDLTKFLNEPDFYDIEIKVGMDQDIKIFKAHSVILKARSLYFKTALSNNWIKKSDDGTILFEKKKYFSKSV